MPYSNVPSALTTKMDRCVTRVQRQGKTKEQAIAICYKSVVTGGIARAATKAKKGG